MAVALDGCDPVSAWGRNPPQPCSPAPLGRPLPQRPACPLAAFPGGSCCSRPLLQGRQPVCPPPSADDGGAVTPAPRAPHAATAPPSALSHGARRPPRAAAPPGCGRASSPPKPSPWAADSRRGSAPQLRPFPPTCPAHGPAAPAPEERLELLVLGAREPRAAREPERAEPRFASEKKRGQTSLDNAGRCFWHHGLPRCPRLPTPLPLLPAAWKARAGAGSPGARSPGVWSPGAGSRGSAGPRPGLV